MPRARYDAAMSFPLTIAEQTFEDAPSLAEAVVADAEAGGGTVTADTRPAEWLTTLLQSDAMERSVLVGLAAWLLRNPNHTAVAEGVELATSLTLTELGPVLDAALDAHDVSLLLMPDPRQPNRSVEDAMLTALARTSQLAEPEIRVRILARLRYAGLSAEELGVLATHGNVEEVAQWLPAILLEGVPDGQGHQLATLLSRDADIALTACKAATVLSPQVRLAIWQAAVASTPTLAQETELQRILLDY